MYIVVRRKLDATKTLDFHVVVLLEIASLKHSPEAQQNNCINL